MYTLGDIWRRPLVIWLFSTCLCHWTTGRYELNTFITLLIYFILDNERYVEANAGCKHFDAHGGPEDIPGSKYYRLSFDAKVQ